MTKNAQKDKIRAELDRAREAELAEQKKAADMSKRQAQKASWLEEHPDWEKVVAERLEARNARKARAKANNGATTEGTEASLAP